MIALDERVFRWLNESFGEGGWLALASALTVLGSGWGMLMILPLYATPRARRFATTLLGVLSATAVVVFASKELVRRKRPYLVLEGVHARIFEAPTSYSFPSGHAAGSFAFATFLAVVLVRHAMRDRKARKRRIALSVLGLTFAFGVAMSRCVLGVHYPGDILAGALLGSALGWTGARMYLRAE